MIIALILKTNITIVKDNITTDGTIFRCTEKLYTFTSISSAWGLVSAVEVAYLANAWVFAVPNSDVIISLLVSKLRAAMPPCSYRLAGLSMPSW